MSMNVMFVTDRNGSKTMTEGERGGEVILEVRTQISVHEDMSALISEAEFGSETVFVTELPNPFHTLKTWLLTPNPNPNPNPLLLTPKPQPLPLPQTPKLQTLNP